MAGRRCWQHVLVLGGCCLLVTLQALAQDGAVPDDRKSQRVRIQQERDALLRTQQRAETACLQRFAVEDCQKKARNEARERLTTLRMQEEALDETQRRERAAERQQAIEARQQERHNRALSPPPAARPDKAPAAQPPERSESDRQQAAQALESARVEKAVRQKTLRDQAAINREKRLAREQAAQARKARADQLRAEDEARGRMPASPLR